MLVGWPLSSRRREAGYPSMRKNVLFSALYGMLSSLRSADNPENLNSGFFRLKEKKPWPRNCMSATFRFLQRIRT